MTWSVVAVLTGGKACTSVCAPLAGVVIGIAAPAVSLLCGSALRRWLAMLLSII
jgi:hypothetical protein